jgi:hypothetical protein
MKTIDIAALVTVTGGNLASSQERPSPLGPRNPGMPSPTFPKPFPGPTFPKPTIPLGPFYPDQPRKDIA